MSEIERANKNRDLMLEIFFCQSEAIIQIMEDDPIMDRVAKIAGTTVSVTCWAKVRFSKYVAAIVIRVRRIQALILFATPLS